MKKKLALLLAGVMTLSAVPSMNLFAASTALLSRDVVSIQRDWWLRDSLSGVAASGASLGGYRALGDPYTNDGDSQPGVDLIIRLDSSVRDDTSREFEVVLSGAEFAFDTTNGDIPSRFVAGRRANTLPAGGIDLALASMEREGSVESTTMVLQERMYGWFENVDNLTVGDTPLNLTGPLSRPNRILGTRNDGWIIGTSTNGVHNRFNRDAPVDIKREPLVTFSPYWASAQTDRGFVTYYRPSGIPDMIAPYVFSAGDANVTPAVTGRGSALNSATLSSAYAEFRHAELAYTLRYSTDNRQTAYVTINENALISNFNTDGRTIRIPLITRITGDEATVQIRGTGASITSTAPMVFARSSGGATSTTISGVQRFRTTVTLDPITITELRVGTIRLSTSTNARYFELEFPQGFVISNSDSEPIRITMLGFGNNTTNVGSLNQQPGEMVGNRAIHGGWEVNPLFSPIPNSTVTARRGRNVLRVQMPMEGNGWSRTGTTSSNTAPGRIVIANLRLTAIEDEADFGDIRMQILDDNFPNQSTTSSIWSATAPANYIRQITPASGRNEYSISSGTVSNAFLTETQYDTLLGLFFVSSTRSFAVNNASPTTNPTRPPTLGRGDTVTFTFTPTTGATLGSLSLVADEEVTVTVSFDRVAGLAEWEIPLNWDTGGGTNYNTWDDATGTTSGPARSYRAEVTDESIIVANRASFSLRFETTNTVPTLVNGRYPENRTNNILTAADFNARHLAARVIFEELAPDSWWVERETNFVLPEGVKIIQARLYANDTFLQGSATDVSVMPNTRASINEKYTWSLSNSDATGTAAYAYENGSIMERFVLTRANSLRLFGLSKRTDQPRRASVQLELWLSIEPGFEGDIMLAVEGTAVPNYDEIPAIKIAEAINPVTVETSVTSVKIGFQSQDVANIKITENGTGFLQRDKDIRLYVEDFARANDSIIVGTGLGSGASAQPNITVEGGGLRLEIPRNVASDLRTGMIVRTASTTGPGTIEIKDVWVRMDRNVPVTNREPYQLLVGGTAIAANYVGFITNNTVPTTRQLSDRFEKIGIGVDFLRVITAAPNETGDFVTMVEIPVDESYMIVDGIRVEIPVPAWIDASASATMLPVRAISMALGIPYEAVQWDPSNPDAPRVTVVAGNRVVQFVIGSDQMSLNGVQTTMFNSNATQPVRAQIRDGSSFVPIRAFEAAFGITIVWREADRTVVLNPDFGVQTQ